jgi:DNA-binding response OmpR family regulator
VSTAYSIVQPLAGRRVLVVEDDALISMLLEEMLADMGAEVAGVAATLQQAIDLAETPADAAIVDVNLAGYSSYPAAQLLAERGVPLLFATGNDRHAPPPELAAAPTLAKPYDFAQVESAILGLLAR